MRLGNATLSGMPFVPQPSHSRGGRLSVIAADTPILRLVRIVAVAVIVLTPLVVALEFWAWVVNGTGLQIVGSDFRIGTDAGRRWMDTGSYFLVRQLDGPYETQIGDVLYPPVALWLFVPFTFLPAVLWWAIPMGITTASLWRLRPSLTGWALLALMCWWPRTWAYVIGGNPSIWVVAILAAALAYGTPASLMLFKPSLFPFALYGIRSRRWWTAAGVLVLGTVPFIPLTLQWMSVMANTGNSLGPLYGLPEITLELIPYAAWLTSQRRAVARLRPDADLAAPDGRTSAQPRPAM